MHAIAHFAGEGAHSVLNVLFLSRRPTAVWKEDVILPSFNTRNKDDVDGDELIIHNSADNSHDSCDRYSDEHQNDNDNEIIET